MLALHKSQKEWLDVSQGLDSYIITMTDLVQQVGKMSNKYEYAEGWMQHSHLGLCSEKADPLKDVLVDKID